MKRHGDTGERHREVVDAQTVGQQRRDGRDLTGELEQRPDLGDVVDHADDRHDRAADEDRHGRRVLLDQHEGGDHDAEVDREAAQQGRDPGVHAAGVDGPVDDPRAPGETSHDRGRAE